MPSIAQVAGSLIWYVSCESTNASTDCYAVYTVMVIFLCLLMGRTVLHYSHMEKHWIIWKC